MLPFETRAREAANDEAGIAYKWATEKLETPDTAIAYENGVRAGYMLGARWAQSIARAEMLREVMEALRTEFDTTDKSAAHHYAKVLESRFANELKDN